MAWIELHQSLTSHRKTRKLAKALGLTTPEGLAQTIGHLCMFWLWSVDGTEGGYLDEMDAGDIARAAGYTGDPETFTAAMVTAGFVDEVKGRKRIHDWEEYANVQKVFEQLQEKLKADRARERLRKAKYREKKAKEGQTETEPEKYRTELTEEQIDRGWVQVLDCYGREIGTPPMGSAMDTLQSYYEDFGAEVVCMAIEEANLAQAGNPRQYLMAILQKWQDGGITTPEKARAYIVDLHRRREAKKRRPQQADEPPSIQGGFY